MGVEPFLVSSSVIAVLAQRLVRTICPECRETYAPTEEELKEIGVLNERQTTNDEPQMAVFYRGKGCPKCMSTGYKGRIGIYELMIPDEKIRNAVISKSSTDEIRKLALAAGMTTLKEDGIRKIKEGLTTVEEVLRVTEED